MTPSRSCPAQQDHSPSTCTGSRNPSTRSTRGGQNTLLNEQVPWGTEPALLLEGTRSGLPGTAGVGFRSSQASSPTPPQGGSLSSHQYVSARDWGGVYRFYPPVKEEMSSTVSCTGTPTCGDDVRRNSRLAGVERQEPNTCALLLEAPYFLFQYPQPDRENVLPAPPYERKGYMRKPMRSSDCTFLRRTA